MKKFNLFCQQTKFRIFRLQSFTSICQFTLELRRFSCKLLLTSVCAYDEGFAFETFETKESWAQSDNVRENIEVFKLLMKALVVRNETSFSGAHAIEKIQKRYFLISENLTTDTSWWIEA